ncbi:DUF2061 domain-containing protein [Xanthovirga aplysinae]|uniref:DUF2061 domain-containing protein n=1 Tax=Xanthovirga aplysinae TaxID=2529853 RepID=UPI0012BBD31A|nr:DUF2061 domain-containing protein [Xanthovirga aplysinae]MTI31287.1 DUF2061 domain-containing protein [Xanthovirga aplysinae]
MLLDQVIKRQAIKKTVGDSQLKSLLKAISWRIVGTIDTIVISFLITGKLTLAISIGSIEVFSKIMLFYVHERLWGKLLLKPLKQDSFGANRNNQ